MHPQIKYIHYRGGSGGFLLFYYLLLSGKYVAGINGVNITPNIQKVKKLIQCQFPITLSSNKHVWKHTEIFTSPELEFPSTFQYLRMTCNNNPFITDKNPSYIIFTNLHAQLRLVYDKCAYVFEPGNNKYADGPALKNILLKNTYKSKVRFNGITIEQQVKEMMDRHASPTLVYLQGLVQGTDPLCENETSDQREFINYWLSLHTEKEKRLLLG
jgi:hypothetical protein